MILLKQQEPLLTGHKQPAGDCNKKLINPKTLLVVCIYLMKSTINYENTPVRHVPLVLLAHEGGDEIIGLGIILENVIEFTMEV